MREIKFRFYNKDNGEVFFPYITGNLYNYIRPTDGAVIEVAEGEKREELVEIVRKHLIPMMYTGLKDKNGTEIYEGDVVVKSYTDYKYADPEYDSKTWDCTEKLVVEYNTKKAMYNLFYKGWDIELEVIGNIYENKELLK